MLTAFWHFARGCAAASKGQVPVADVERGSVEAARRVTPADAEYSWYANKAHSFLDLAADILDARIAAAQGDSQHAIASWKGAVEIEDSLNYGEPPEWFYPVRESLGAALLLNGQASEAESVFRADLRQYPRNPRSLFGLLKSLEAQKKTSEANSVRREFEAAWKHADVRLDTPDL
jgi:hypothetical protein